MPPMMLDGPPPAPAMGAGSAAPPQASLDQLGGPGASQGQDQSIQIISQHLMTAEQELRAAARIKPELAGVLDQWITQMKGQIGQILFGSQPQPQGGGGLMTSGANSLNIQP